MARSDLEQRVANLESQVEKLAERLQANGKSPAGKDWRRAVEKFAGDPDLQSIFAEAMKLREAERRRVRRTERPARRKQR